jgi:hypothetical protein
MAPIVFTVVTRENKRFPIATNTEDSILQLVRRVEEATGLNRDTFDLLPEGRQTFLSDYESNSNIKNIDGLKMIKTLRLYPRKKKWRYTYNRSSLVEPSEKRYHSRILKEKLEKILAEKRRQRAAAANAIGSILAYAPPSAALPSGGPMYKRGLRSWTEKVGRGGKQTRKATTRRYHR